MAASQEDHSVLLSSRSRSRKGGHGRTESIISDHDETTQGVARGSIGGGYGPYSVSVLGAQLSLDSIEPAA